MTAAAAAAAYAEPPLGLALVETVDVVLTWSHAILPSPDGRVVLVLGDDLVLCEVMCDAYAHWRVRWRLQGLYVKQAVFSPNSRCLAIVTSSGVPCEILDVRTGAEMTGARRRLSLSANGGDVSCVAWSKANVIAVGLADGLICIQVMDENLDDHGFDNDGGAAGAATGGEGGGGCTPAVTLSQPEKIAITCLAFAPDGSLLAAGDGHGGIKLWTMATCDTLKHIKHHTCPITCISFSPDGQHMASCDKGQQITVSVSESFHRIHSFKGRLPRGAACWSQTSSHFLYLPGCDQISLQCITATRQLPRSSVPPETTLRRAIKLHDAVFSPDGNEIWTIDAGRISRWLSPLFCVLPRAHFDEGVNIINKMSGGNSNSTGCGNNDDKNKSSSTTTHRIQLGDLRLRVSLPTKSVEEQLDSVRTLINRTELPHAFGELLRLLHRLKAPIFNLVSERLLAETEIDKYFAIIADIQCDDEIQANRESFLQACESPLAHLEAALRRLPKQPSPFETAEAMTSIDTVPKNADIAQTTMDHVQTLSLSCSDLDDILDFAHESAIMIASSERAVVWQAQRLLKTLTAYSELIPTLHSKSEAFTAALAPFCEQHEQMMITNSGSAATICGNMESNVDGSDAGMDQSENRPPLFDVAASSESYDTKEMQVEKQVGKQSKPIICIKKVAVLGDQISGISASADGKYILMRSLHGLSMRDAKTGAEMWGMNRRVVCAAFSPTGANVALCLYRSRPAVGICESASGVLKAGLESNDAASVLDFASSVRDLAWSVQDVIATIPFISQSVNLWHPDGTFIKKLENPDSTSPTFVSFSKDGSLLATSYLDCYIRIWDVASGSIAKILENGEGGEDDNQNGDGSGKEKRDGSIWSCSFSPDGTKLASLTCTHLTLWETNQFTVLHQFKPNISSFIWAPNSRLLVNLSDNMLQVYAVDTAADLTLAAAAGEKTRDVHADDCVYQHRLEADRITFSHDGGDLITVNGSNNELQFWKSPVNSIRQRARIAANDDIIKDFGQMDLPPLQTLTDSVHDALDRMAALIDQLQHPVSFYRLVNLLHRIDGPSFRISRLAQTTAAFVEETSLLQILDFVDSHGIHLRALEADLIVMSKEFSKALIEYDSCADMIRQTSERNIDKLAAFLAHLSRPPMDVNHLLRIQSIAAQIRAKFKEFAVSFEPRGEEEKRLEKRHRDHAGGDADDGTISTISL